MSVQFSIIDDIKNSLRYGNTTIRLIWINVGVFVVLGLIRLLGFLFGINTPFQKIVEGLALPSSLKDLMWQPWSLITHLFLHIVLWHIFMNMLVLYWFGNILSDFVTQRRILPVYILGGLAGAVAVLLSYALFPVFRNSDAIAYGASASVMAILTCMAAISPNYTLHLILLGRIPIKFLALALFIIDLISIPQSNAGGHIAHIGGAIFGIVYARQWQRGDAWGKTFNRLTDKVIQLIDKNKEPAKQSYQQPKNTTRSNSSPTLSEQERIDQILDKIAQTGYDSLTQEEKTFLFKVSNKK